MANPSARRVGFGIATAQEGTDYQGIKAHWLEAGKLGYDSCWLDDYLFGTRQRQAGISRKVRPTSGWAGLAEATSTLRFGPLVTCNNCLEYLYLRSRERPAKYEAFCADGDPCFPLETERGGQSWVIHPEGR